MFAPWDCEKRFALSMFKRSVNKNRNPFNIFSQPTALIIHMNGQGANRDRMSQREEERGEARRGNKVQKYTPEEWLRPVCPGAIAQTSKEGEK